MKKRSRDRRSGCPISLALEIFGDTGSLLIVRDLLFKGFGTYNEFLGAGEGIATNVLTDRLSRLEAEGLAGESLTSPMGHKTPGFSSKEM